MKINQSETAIKHYHNVVKPAKHRQIATILLEMTLGTDWTIGEIAHALGMEKSTVSARRAEMLASGRIVKGEKRHCRQSGVMCETVKLKITQWELV